MRPIQFILMDIDATIESRKADLSADLRKEAVHFRKLQQEAQEIAGQVLPDPVKSMRTGTPLSELQKLADDIKDAAKNSKIYEGVANKIVAEIAPAERPMDKLLNRIHHLVEVSTTNRKNFTIAAAAGEPQARLFEEAFNGNLYGLIRLLNSNDFSVDLIREVEATMKHIEPITLGEIA